MKAAWCVCWAMLALSGCTSDDTADSDRAVDAGGAHVPADDDGVGSADDDSIPDDTTPDDVSSPFDTGDDAEPIDDPPDDDLGADDDTALDDDLGADNDSTPDDDLASDDDTSDDDVVGDDDAAPDDDTASDDDAGDDDTGLSGGGSAGNSGPGGAQNGGGSGGGVANGGAGGTNDGDRSNCKRGVAYGYHSQADIQALSPGVSWWYNWAFVPDEALRDGSYLSLDVEYAPMIWGANSDRSSAAENIPDDARVLLGFNEPNFGSQANMSAEEAAELWPELEAIADERGLDLVSPAVNFCGGDCQNTDPFDYLDDFLAACEGCRVDALGIHIYVGCNPDGENHAEWLINHVETYKSRFSHPLWLTEFACDSAANEDEQIGFMEDAVEYLENEPRIARYAWFAGRADNVANVDLLGADGELTRLGQRYVELEHSGDCAR